MTHRLTELGNSERLAEQYGEDWRYCHEHGCWYVWTGKRWEADRSGKVMQRAKATVLDMYREALSVQSHDEKARLVKWAVQSEKRAAIENMVVLARSALPVRASELDTDPWLFNVANGTLDLRTCELREHRRSDRITKLAPVAYDAAATCPRFIAFLTQIMGGDATLVDFLQRFFGYVLAGTTREQCLLILYGDGANGKTTLLEVLRCMLGDYAKVAEFRTFLEKRGDGPRDDLADLAGARLVTASEGQHGRALDEVTVKQLTGGDMVKCRPLYGKYFEYLPQFKIVLATNSQPLVRGTNEAIWRRLKKVPCEVTIPEADRDPNLLDKLTAELPGILAWAVQGCALWQKHGLGVPAAVQDATATYRAEMDVVAAFIWERCRTAPGLSVPMHVLYDSYKTWCVEATEVPESERGFGTALTRKGFTASRRGGVAIREGITLAPRQEDRGVDALTVGRREVQP